MVHLRPRADRVNGQFGAVRPSPGEGTPLRTRGDAEQEGNRKGEPHSVHCSFCGDRCRGFFFVGDIFFNLAFSSNQLSVVFSGILVDAPRPATRTKVCPATRFSVVFFVSFLSAAVTMVSSRTGQVCSAGRGGAGGLWKRPPVASVGGGKKMR
jgi:hypothetical protein